MNPSFFRAAMVATLGFSLQLSLPAASAQEEPSRDPVLWEKALKLHRSSMVIDSHNDITGAMTDENYNLSTPSLGKYHTDLGRLKQGGVGAQFFAIYVAHQYVTNGAGARRALSVIDAVNRNIEKNPNDLMFAGSVADIRRARESGKIAALMGVENGAAIENSLSVLRSFYRLGVRYMTLTHFQPNDWADASTTPPVHNGLTDFGKAVVAEMNRLGMMVDVSHVADKTMSDALDVSRAPVIASHSSARALSLHPRNIPDELLKRIGEKRGVVMVNFFPAFIDPRVRAMYEQISPKMDELRERYKDDLDQYRAERKKLIATIPSTPLDVVMQHIEHIIKVAGIDSVGLGSDFDGISVVPKGISDVSEYPNITYELLKRGYGESDVRKVLGENLLRVFGEVERVAKATNTTLSGDGDTQKLRKSRSPGASR